MYMLVHSLLCRCVLVCLCCVCKRGIILRSKRTGWLHVLTCAALAADSLQKAAGE